MSEWMPLETPSGRIRASAELALARTPGLFRRALRPAC